MGGLLRSLWAGRGFPPAWLAGRTPFEILFLFAGDGPRPDPVADPLAHLRRVNGERAAKGLPPLVPPWALTGVPRRGR